MARGNSIEKRIEAVRRLQGGESIKTIAKYYDVKDSTVVRWTKQDEVIRGLLEAPSESASEEPVSVPLPDKVQLHEPISAPSPISAQDLKIVSDFVTQNIESGIRRENKKRFDRYIVLAGIISTLAGIMFTIVGAFGYSKISREVKESVAETSREIKKNVAEAVEEQVSADDIRQDAQGRLDKEIVRVKKRGEEFDSKVSLALGAIETSLKNTRLVAEQLRVEAEDLGQRLSAAEGKLVELEGRSSSADLSIDKHIEEVGQARSRAVKKLDSMMSDLGGEARGMEERIESTGRAVDAYGERVGTLGEDLKRMSAEARLLKSSIDENMKDIPARIERSYQEFVKFGKLKRIGISPAALEKVLGYYSVGGATSISMRDRIQGFQSAHGLEVDGEIDFCTAIGIAYKATELNIVDKDEVRSSPMGRGNADGKFEVAGCSTRDRSRMRSLGAESLSFVALLNLIKLELEDFD